MTVAAEAQSPEVSGFPQSTGELHRTIIQPSQGWVSLRLKELWHYRELLFFLAWRDVKVRYKQSALGVAWAVLQRNFVPAVQLFRSAGLADCSLIR